MTPTRRGVIAAVAGAAAGLRARPSAASTIAPEAAVLLAPGPEDGPTAGFARRAASGLSRALVRAAALRVAVLGGPDGITAANRFATSTPQEDRVLLMLPGLAGHAHLVGDSRARFEPRHWPAICASLMPAILAGRMPAPGAPIRLALPAPGAPEAAGLLALDLCARTAVAVLPGPGQSPESLVQAGAADALVLAGPALPARAAALGLQPWFAFDGAAQLRDPALPDVPALAELLPDPPHMQLVEAARAAGAALRCRGVLVLPALTSADAVALWRGAARRWAEEEPQGIEPGTRRTVDGEAVATLAALFPAPEAALAYREWQMRRLGWRAG